MILSTPLPLGGVIDITFPFSQYLSGLGLSSNFKVYFNYPNLISASVTDRTIKCQVGKVEEGKANTITVQGVVNPLKVGGTGNFRMTSRINNNPDSFILDDNKMFGVVGISEPAGSLIDSRVIIEGDSSAYDAGETGNYCFFFKSSEFIESNFVIRVIFPEIYYLDYIYSRLCESVLYDGYKLSGDIRCNVDNNFKNIVDFINIEDSIIKGRTYKLMIKNIRNPSIKMITNLFTLKILDKGSNNTLQVDRAVTGINILSGRINMVSMTGYYSGYLNFKGFERIFKLIFKPKNPFNAIRISTSFKVFRCYVTKGLLDLDENSNILCNPQANIIFITNFKQYTESEFDNDYIETLIYVVLPTEVFVSNPIEIYTYLDDKFLKLVDKNTGSEETRIAILSKRNNYNNLYSSLYT